MNYQNVNSAVSLHYPDKESETSILVNIPHSQLTLAKTFGQVSKNEFTNKLIQGDNLSILSTLVHDPKIKGNVKLVYIDPPFGTGNNYDEKHDLNRTKGKAYDDSKIGFEYIEFLRKRLVLLREILADDGSIYVHLDQRMAHYTKIIMDEIFGQKNFRSWITRQKCHPKGTAKNSYGNIQDFILFYTKGKKHVWNRPFSKLTKEKIKSSEYRYTEEGTGRIFKKVPIHAPGIRNGETGKEWKGMKPLKGKHWQWTPAKLDEFEKNGRIYWSKTGNPRLKVYLDEREGISVQDIWLEYLDPMNQFGAQTNYPTEKNQELLERIIQTSSNENDLVLDCFVGSGTTIAAASKLKRKWIGIDNSKPAIDTTIKRLTNPTKIRKEHIKTPFFEVYHTIY